MAAAGERSLCDEVTSARTGRHAPPAKPQPATPVGDLTGRAVPSRASNRRRRSEIRIVRIETVPMTAAEYERAVDALAILICRWWAEHPERDS